MFCLRSWIPILFFLTTAPPIYLFLFIGATYYLNRPCVYCSLLLFILVVSLFDFRQGNWFDARHPNGSIAASPEEESQIGAVQTLALETASIILSGVNTTMSAISNTTGYVGAAVEGLKKKAQLEGGLNLTSNGSELVKSGLRHKEWRIPCIDVLVRL